jgi:hypothetical protein
MIYFVERLTNIERFGFADGKMLVSSLGGINHEFLPVSGMQFRRVPKDGPPAPAATVELLAPDAPGQYIQSGGGTQTMKKIPTLLAIAEILLVAWVILAIVSILVYAPFWLLGGLSKKRRRRAERAMRLWPLVAVLSLVAAILIFMHVGDDLIPLMGNATIWSFAFFLATIVFAIASIAGAIALWRAPRQEVRPRVRKFSIAVTLALLIASAYLAYWGMIGVRTWA